METRRTIQLASRPTRSAIQAGTPAVTECETTATIGDLVGAVYVDGLMYLEPDNLGQCGVGKTGPDSSDSRRGLLASARSEGRRAGWRGGDALVQLAEDQGPRSSSAAARTASCPASPACRSRLSAW